MPMINIEFDDKKVSTKEILLLSNAIQKIVSEATGIKDVFVYANTSKIKVKIAPIEIWVRMSAHKIKNQDELFEELKNRLSKWKKKSGFKHPVNLTLIPMNWKFEVGI
jgi:hypothetical protein